MSQDAKKAAPAAAVNDMPEAPRQRHEWVWVVAAAAVFVTGYTIKTTDPRPASAAIMLPPAAATTDSATTAASTESGSSGAESRRVTPVLTQIQPQTSANQTSRQTSAPVQSAAPTSVNTASPTVAATADTASAAARRAALNELTELLTASESALADGDIDNASSIGVRTAETLDRVARQLEPATAQSMRARVTSVQNAVAAVKRLDSDIRTAVGRAQNDARSGNYPAAIAALRAVQTRASAAPASERNAARQLLLFYSIEQTIRKLTDDCEFERKNLGRTEPCLVH